MVKQLLSAQDLKTQTDNPMMSTNTGAKPGYISSGLPVNKGLPAAPVVKPPAVVPNAQPIGAIAGVNAPSPVQQAVSTAQANPAMQKDFTNAFSPKVAPNAGTSALNSTTSEQQGIPIVHTSEQVDKALGDLVGDMTNVVKEGRTPDIVKLKSLYPEFSHLDDSVIKDLTADLGNVVREGRTVDINKLKELYPELSGTPEKTFDEMNTYEKIMYIPKNPEERKTLPVRKRVLSVGTPTQETATAMGATRNDVDALEQNVRGAMESLAGFGKGSNALLDKLLGGDGVGVQVLNDYSMQTRGQTIGDLMESNPEDYKALLKEIEDGKADEFKTSASQDVLNMAEGGLAAAQLAAAPMIFGGITVAGSTDVGSKAMEAVNTTLGGVGYVVNLIPGLSDYKASLPEEDQKRFDIFVGNVIGSLLLGTKGKGNIIKDPKQFISDNVGSKQIIDNFKQNVIGLTEPVVKAAEVVKDKLNPAINLDEASMQEAKKNPYIAETLNAINEATDGEMSKVDTSNTPSGFKNTAVKKVGDDYIQPKLKELEDTYSDGGQLYQDIRKSGQKVDVSNLVEETNAAIDKYAPSSLTPGDERLIAAVKRQVEKIVEDSKNGRFTADVALDSRKAISDLTNWDEQGQRRQQSNSKGDAAVKDVRKILDEKMKTQIAGLREIDALASKKIKELAEFKKQLIKQDGSVNYNNLKNTNTLAKTDLAVKLDEYVPGATDRIDAIDKAIKIAQKTKGIGTLGKITSKAILGPLGAAIGSIVPFGSFIGFALGELLSPMIENAIGGKLSEANQAKVMNFFQELSPEAKARLDDIGKKIQQNEDLSAADQELIKKARQKFKEASSSKPNNNVDISTTSVPDTSMSDTNTPNPTKKGLKVKK